MIARKMMAVIVGLALGWGGSVALRSLPDAAPPSEVPEWTTLSGMLPDSLGPQDRNALYRVSLLVDAVDVAHCEDLGRQVRQFLREQIEGHQGTAVDFEVWVTNPDDAARVKAFFSRERIFPSRFRTVASGSVLGRQDATPAIIVANRFGAFYGIGYTNRTRLVRTIDFADLLHLSTAIAIIDARASATGARKSHVPR